MNISIHSRWGSSWLSCFISYGDLTNIFGVWRQCAHFGIIYFSPVAICLQNSFIRYLDNCNKDKIKCCSVLDYIHAPHSSNMLSKNYLVDLCIIHECWVVEWITRHNTLFCSTHDTADCYIHIYVNHNVIWQCQYVVPMITALCIPLHS